jgi:proteic killer suppression protein
MIKSFGSKATEDLFHGIQSREAKKIPGLIWKVACRKLDMINTVAQLKDLSSPPANRLEALKGEFKGKYSIRINDQYRIIFGFQDGNAYEVEITDYH